MKTGDVIVVHSGKSIVPKAIASIMRKYIKKNKYNCKPYHHAGTIVKLDGYFYVAEANKPGFQITRIDDAYNSKSWAERIDIRTPIKPYSDQEQYRLTQAALNYSMKVTRYDYMNFIWWLYYFITGLWIGKNNNRLYCSEAVAELANKIRPGTFKNPQRTNPVDVAVNENYKLLVPNSYISTFTYQ